MGSDGHGLLENPLEEYSMFHSQQLKTNIWAIWLQVLIFDGLALGGNTARKPIYNPRIRETYFVTGALTNKMQLHEQHRAVD